MCFNPPPPPPVGGLFIPLNLSSPYKLFPLYSQKMKSLDEKHGNPQDFHVGYKNKASGSLWKIALASMVKD